MRKRRRKKRYFLRAMLFLLAALLIGACVYLYPTWRAAKAMQDELALPYKAFALEVELDREQLSAEQAKMFGTLEKLTGIEEDALYRLTIRGGMEEDRVHLTIYPEGRTEPLFELYLSDDIDVINETMVYNAIRSHLTAKFGLLAHLMPAQEETLYLTLEQVEQLFGTDLSGLADFRLGAWDRRVNAKECFLLLAVMSREKQKDGYRFTLDIGQADICIALDGGGADRAMRLELRAEEPMEVLRKADRALPWLEKWLPGKEAQGMKGLKSISLTLESQEGRTITMPTNLADQDTINTISAIRQWFQETFSGKEEADDNEI